MVYNGINFTEAYWKNKTLHDFLKHEKHHGLTEEQLKEAFELMVKPSEKKETAKEVSK